MERSDLKKEDVSMLQLRIDARGNSIEDLADAVGEVLIRLGEGYLLGKDQNDEGGYLFQVSEGDEAVEADEEER